jgi:hypothetical protein
LEFLLERSQTFGSFYSTILYNICIPATCGYFGITGIQYSSFFRNIGNICFGLNGFQVTGLPVRVGICAVRVTFLAVRVKNFGIRVAHLAVRVKNFPLRAGIFGVRVKKGACLSEQAPFQF